MLREQYVSQAILGKYLRNSPLYDNSPKYFYILVHDLLTITYFQRTTETLHEKMDGTTILVIFGIDISLALPLKVQLCVS